MPGTLSARISANTPGRFGVALFATLLALLIARSMTALAGGSLPYFTAIVALAFSTWLCGTGPAIASLALSLLTIGYPFVHLARSSQISQTADWVNFLAFLCAGVAIVVIGESTHQETERLRNAPRSSMCNCLQSVSAQRKFGSNS